ncbi:MAG: hypothetical protein R3Y53_04170 [Bacillota bacterium]
MKQLPPLAKIAPFERAFQKDRVTIALKRKSRVRRIWGHRLNYKCIHISIVEEELPNFSWGEQSVRVYAHSSTTRENPHPFGENRKEDAIEK